MPPVSRPRQPAGDNMARLVYSDSNSGIAGPSCFSLAAAMQDQSQYSWRLHQELATRAPRQERAEAFLIPVIQSAGQGRRPRNATPNVSPPVLLGPLGHGVRGLLFCDSRLAGQRWLDAKMPRAPVA